MNRNTTLNYGPRGISFISFVFVAAAVNDE